MQLQRQKQFIVEAVQEVFGKTARVQGQKPPFTVWAKKSGDRNPVPFVEGCQISRLKTRSDGSISFLVELKSG